MTAPNVAAYTDEYTMPSFGAKEDALVEFINTKCWKEWKPAYRAWERQVEENVRMLSGRQWDTYMEGIGQFVDLSSWFAAGDERWRQYPVFNWLITYFKQTISKLTENTPAIGVMPATSDFRDAMLAEVVEPIWKYEWDQMDLPEQMFDLYGWCLVAGRGVLKLRWDPSKGPMEEFYGPATLQLQDPTGNIIERQIDNAPYLQMPDGSFQPHILGQQEPDGSMSVTLDENGDPAMGPAHVNYLGDMDADSVCPTSVITPHGPENFMKKSWYTHEYLLPIEVARLRFNQPDLPCDDFGGEEDLLLNLQYGSHYGMPGSIFGGNSLTPNRVALKGMVRVREHWRRQVPNHPDLMYGRLTIVTKEKVLYDDINPYVVPGQQNIAVLPFYAFDLIKLPFKQEGTTDFEFLNPVQRAGNRRMGGIMDAVDFNEQPLTIVNSAAGLEDQIDNLNRAGGVVTATWNGQGPPVERLPAVEIPKGSVDLLNILRDWMFTLGGTNEGAEGNAVSTDASGELQREVRYDADRPWGATLRRHSYIWARVAADMMVILGVAMEDSRLLALSGEDNAWKFIHVNPEMFQGRVQIRPQPESAVLESRQDKQNRITNLVANQMLPPDIGLQAMGYPDLVRLLRPNKEAYSLAQRENAELAMGTLSPVLPEHDHATHLLEHKKIQQTVEYRNYPEPLKNIIRLHIMFHENMLPQQAMHDAQVMMPAMQAGAMLQATAAGAALPGAGQSDQKAPAGPPQK